MFIISCPAPLQLHPQWHCKSHCTISIPGEPRRVIDVKILRYSNKFPDSQRTIRATGRWLIASGFVVRNNISDWPDHGEILGKLCLFFIQTFIRFRGINFWNWFDFLPDRPSLFSTHYSSIWYRIYRCIVLSRDRLKFSKSRSMMRKWRKVTNGY